VVGTEILEWQDNDGWFSGFLGRRRTLCRFCLGCRRSVDLCLFLDLTDKPEPSPAHGLDQSLLVTIIANGLAKGFDAGRYGSVRDVPVVPDFPNDLILANQTIAIGDQQAKQIEGARFNINGPSGPSELRHREVYFLVFKRQNHRRMVAKKSSITCGTDVRVRALAESA